MVWRLLDQFLIMNPMSCKEDFQSRITHTWSMIYRYQVWQQGFLVTLDILNIIFELIVCVTPFSIGWREETPVSFFLPPSCYWKPLTAFSQALLVLSLEGAAVIAPWQNTLKWNTKEMSSNREKLQCKEWGLIFLDSSFKCFGLSLWPTDWVWHWITFTILAMSLV